MAAVVTTSAANQLTATLTGSSIVSGTHSLLVTQRVKFLSAGAGAECFAILDSATETHNHVIYLDSATSKLGVYYTVDAGTSIEWNPVITGGSAVDFAFWGLCAAFYPANNAGSMTTKAYYENLTATVARTGDATTKTIDTMHVGDGFSIPDFKTCELALWRVADVTAADRIFAALWNDGRKGRYANGISRVATPDYYWPLAANENAALGSPALSNSGVTFDSDNPSLENEYPSDPNRNRRSLLLTHFAA